MGSLPSEEHQQEPGSWNCEQQNSFLVFDIAHHTERDASQDHQVGDQEDRFRRRISLQKQNLTIRGLYLRLPGFYK